MTNEESTLLSLIKLKVEALNSSIELFGKSLSSHAVDKRREYMAATARQRFLPLKWLRQLKTPQVIDYRWRELDFVTQLEQLLIAQEVDWRNLASQLNLYALNAALEMTRHKAEKEVLRLVKDVALIAESARNFEQRNNLR